MIQLTPHHMNIASLWKHNSEQISFPQLDRDITVDVVIIGGGITGITAAMLLSKAGKKVAVIEALLVAGGSTGFSTGNLYNISGSESINIVRNKWGTEQAAKVVRSREEAINFIESCIIENDIRCDFKRVPWSIFSETGESKSYIDDEREAAESAGIKTSDEIPVNIPTLTGFSIPHQAQFNPYQYTVSLAKAIASDNCSIYENTKMLEYTDGEPCTVTTPSGKITAKKIVMATHTPKGIFAVHTMMGPYREYAIAATLKDNNYPPAGIFWDMKVQDHYSIRTADSSEGKILVAIGQKHKVGHKEENETQFNKLESFISKRYNVDAIKFRWAAQQYQPADRIPFIGTSSGTQNVYIATGFSADGLVYGTLAAMIISDQLSGKDNPYTTLYNASRVTPLASAPRFIKENMMVGFDLIKDYFFKKDATYFAEIGEGEGRIMEIEGKKCGVSRDESGGLHAVTALCPHMGCTVHFNQAEKSWDCPCHGSRFMRTGEVIEGPAISHLGYFKIDPGTQGQ